MDATTGSAAGTSKGGTFDAELAATGMQQMMQQRVVMHHQQQWAAVGTSEGGLSDIQHIYTMYISYII